MIREVKMRFEIVLYVCSFLLSWSPRRYQNYSTRCPRPYQLVPSRANRQLGHRLLTPLALQIPHSYLGLEFVNNPFASASSFREAAQLRDFKISSPMRPFDNNNQQSPSHTTYYTISLLLSNNLSNQLQSHKPNNLNNLNNF